MFLILRKLKEACAVIVVNLYVFEVCVRIAEALPGKDEMDQRLEVTVYKLDDFIL